MTSTGATATDLFARVPLRALEALLRGDLTFQQFGVAAFLCAAADYRTRTYTGTLAELRAECGFPKSPDTLLRVLDALQAGGWIEFERRQGQRRPYVIRLRALLVDDLRKNEAPSAELSSARIPSETSANRAAVRDSAAVGHPHASGRPSTSSSEGRIPTTVGGWTRESSALEATERLLDRLREVRREHPYAPHDLDALVEPARSVHPFEPDTDWLDPNDAEIERLADLARRVHHEANP